MVNEKMLNTRILLKYDTLEKWNDSKGILRAGEVAIATVPEGGSAQEVGSVKTPQVLVKVGDGKHTFAQLPFITARAGDVYAWAKAEKLGKDAFSKEVNELFTNIENDITALEGKVGDGKVGDQINAAITAALKKLANGDAAVEKQFVTAAVQGEDGKVVVSRRALEAADIPVIDEAQVSGLTTKLTNIGTEIEGVKTTATENLAEAKDYTDTEVKKLADGAVADNTAAIGVINGTGAGSIKQALADAKGYTDTEVGNAKTAAATDAQNKANKALEDAQKYVDDAISAITGGETGSLKALEKRVTANEAAIGTMPPAGEDGVAPTLVGMIEAAKQEAADAVDAEELRATNAETALDTRLDAVETFFHFSSEEEKNAAYDTLKEIQDYIEGDASAAAQLTAKVNQNTAALGAVEFENGVPKKTLTAMIEEAAQAASQAVENEATRAKGEEARIEGLANAAQGAADKAQGAVNTLADKVGAVAENKTVVEMIAEAQAAATYDDAEVRELIGANTTAIGNEVTRAKGAEEAINTKIGADALTGGHTTLIAAINAANAGVSANAVEIQKNAQAIAAINHGTTGILATAKGYTDAEIVKVNNAITGLSGEAVKTVEFANKSGKGEKVLGGKIENNKLTVEFDDTLTFVLKAGDSTNLDAPATT